MTALASAGVSSMQLNGMYFFNFVALSFFKIWSTKKCDKVWSRHWWAQCVLVKTSYRKMIEEVRMGSYEEPLAKKKKIRMGTLVWRKRGKNGQRSGNEGSTKRNSFLTGAEDGSFWLRQMGEIMTGCLSFSFQLPSPSVIDNFSVFEGELVQ